MRRRNRWTQRRRARLSSRGRPAPVFGSQLPDPGRYIEEWRSARLARRVALTESRAHPAVLSVLDTIAGYLHRHSVGQGLDPQRVAFCHGKKGRRESGQVGCPGTDRIGRQLSLCPTKIDIPGPADRVEAGMKAIREGEEPGWSANSFPSCTSLSPATRRPPDRAARHCGPAGSRTQRRSAWSRGRRQRSRSSNRSA